MHTVHTLLKLLPIICIIWCATACQNQDQHPAQALGILPPPSLQEMDGSVREQFHELWRNLDTNNNADVSSTDLGALCMWFHIYQFPESASQCYDKVIDSDEQNGQWYYYQSDLMRKTGNLEEARLFVQKACRNSPKNPICEQHMLEASLNDGNYDDVIAQASNMINGDSNHIGALFYRAQAYLQNGDPRSAIEDYSHILTLQETASDVQYQIAQAYMRAGDPASAEKHLARIPEIHVEQQPLQLPDPWLTQLQRMDRSVKALNIMSYRAAQSGNFSAAISLAKSAVKSDPEHTEMHANLISLHLQAGQPRLALQNIAALLRKDPDNTRALTMYADILIRQRDLAAALKQTEKVILTDPKNRQANLLKVRILMQQSEFEKAIAFIEAPTMPQPLSTEIQTWYVTALTLLGNSTKAREIAQEQLQLAKAKVHWSSVLLRLEISRCKAHGPCDSTLISDLAQNIQNSQTLQQWDMESLAMWFADQQDFTQAEALQSQAVTLCELRQGMVNACRHAIRRLALYREQKPVITAWLPGEYPRTFLGEQKNG